MEDISLVERSQPAALRNERRARSQPFWQRLSRVGASDGIGTYRNRRATDTETLPPKSYRRPTFISFARSVFGFTEFKPRTTLSIDPSMIRGTDSATLLGRCGRTLWTNDPDQEDEFDSSFPAPCIDIFLSHSWHASWVLKYLTLLLYFNIYPAIFASVAVAGSMFAFFHSTGSHWKEHDTTTKHFHEPVRLECFAAGGCMFFLTLLTWHYVVAGLPVSKRFSPSIFLDKVCICQTDVELKKQGIRSIGGILANSKMMLVAWDATYFSRLWCTYELSVFMYAMPESSVVVTPVFSSQLVLACIAGTATSEIVLAIASRIQYKMEIGTLSVHQYYTFFCVCASVTFFFLCTFVRRYAEQLLQLDSQLANFSVHSAQCFCCNHDHRHPETGAPLVCDRELVYNSISHFQGSNGLGEDLRHFNNTIRTSFKKKVQESLGMSSCLPYSSALAIGLFNGMATLDWGLVSHQHWTLTLGNACYWFFFCFPILMGICTHLAVYCVCQAQSKRLKVLFNILMAGFFAGTLELMVTLHMKAQDTGIYARYLELGIEIVVTSFLYGGRRRLWKSLRAREEAWQIPCSVELAQRKSDASESVERTTDVAAHAMNEAVDFEDFVPRQSDTPVHRTNEAVEFDGLASFSVAVSHPLASDASDYVAL